MTTRVEHRRASFVRMWRILVLLRQRPHSLDELAQMLGAAARTIRRDLHALQSVPLPIESRFPTGEAYTRRGVQAGAPNVWALGEVPAWPRREIAPISDVATSPSPLPPFPKGPLFPAGTVLPKGDRP